MNKQKRVPFFNYPHVFTNQENQFVKIFTDVGRQGAFIMQKELSDFENELASFCDVKYAVGVANATDGLQMGLMAGNIGKHDEVIFCSHTMVATASAIYFSGATPIPVEAGIDHLIDSKSIENAITTKTKAIVPTHLNGRTANMDVIQDIAGKYGLQIFEDAAQALGSKFKNRYAGTFGTAACISFYPAKILGCLGDGGAVLTDNEDTYRKLLLLRDHGRDENGDVVLWGMNSRLDNLQAAFLKYQLVSHQKVIKRRRYIACIYQERLGNVEQIELPPRVENSSDHFDVFQNYEIEAENRDKLKLFLFENGVGTLVQWGGKAVHQFRKLGFSQSLPFTERLFDHLLMLPMNISLSDDDVNYVCDCIINFYNK